jgi:antitoxin (DNA-binding transcriptional repressor) of toxin-antitoxin stability system
VATPLPDLLSRVLDRAGLLAAFQADFDRAMQLTECCLAIRRGLGDREGIAETLANLAYVLIHRDDFDRAVEISHESLAIQREIGSDQGRVDALSNLALIAYYRGEPQAGRSLAVESLRIWEALGYQQGVAWALQVLGNIEVSLRRYIPAMAGIRHRTVGLRELKTRFSEYVRMVRSGAHVQVTDRGQVVAELLPPGSAADREQHPGLAALHRRGLLRVGAPNTADLYPSLRRSSKPGRARRLLDAVRAER